MNTPATPWYFTVFMANAFKIRSAPCDWIQLAHKSKLCQHERLSHWRTYAAPRCASMAAVGADGRSPDAALLRREILGIKYTFVRGLADNNKKRLKMLKRHLNLNIYISTAWDASLDVIATFISRRPVHVCSLFSKFNLWLHIQHHASSRLLSALLRRCPELWCCQRCLSDRSRWWKKAKRACTSGTCSSVLRTLLDVELLNALIQSVRYCISIYYTPISSLINILFCIASVHRREFAALFWPLCTLYSTQKLRLHYSTKSCVRAASSAARAGRISSLAPDESKGE